MGLGHGGPGQGALFCITIAAINNQQDLVEISGLMARGLTLEDARSYQKNKIEQAAIEKRMSETSTKPTQFPTRGRGKGTRTTKP